MYAGKVKLSDFTNPDITLLTKAGHCELCHYIALTDAFPLPIDKEEVSWKCLVKGAHRNEEMINKLEALEANSTLKSWVIDYVRAHFLAYVYLLTQPYLGMGSWDTAQRRAHLQSESSSSQCIQFARKFDRRRTPQGPQLAHSAHAADPSRHQCQGMLASVVFFCSTYFVEGLHLFGG